MNAMDRLDQVESELESAVGYAEDSGSSMGMALDELRALKEEVGKLNDDWKEYLSDNVDTDELYEYLCELGASDLNYIAKKSIAYADKQKESDQIQKVYWEEVEANRLARALMFAAFLANTAASVMELADAIKATREETIEELERKEKSQANFVESLKGDLRAGLVRADDIDAFQARVTALEHELEDLKSEANRLDPNNA